MASVTLTMSGDDLARVAEACRYFYALDAETDVELVVRVCMAQLDKLVRSFAFETAATEVAEAVADAPSVVIAVE